MVMTRGKSLLHGCKILECNVDWLTATVRHGTEQRALARLAEDWLLDRSCEGYRVQGWRWNNYVGSQTDGISFGKRDDGWIIRLSGPMATRHWLTVATWAHNISRFDVQTTLLSTTPRDEHAVAGFATLALDPRISNGLVTSKLIESTPDGSTLYLGSRSSDRFFRVYDKTAESDGDYPSRSWRYEIEYKGERAKKVADAIRADRHPTQAIWDCLQTAFTSWGIGIPGDRPGWQWRDAAIPHTSDDAKRLAWLRRCIRPCVSKLTEVFGVDEVLMALGVCDEVDELTGEMERTILRDLVLDVT